MDSLESQHREKESVFESLKALWGELESGVTSDRAERYRVLTARLCELYRTHIASEDDVLVRTGPRVAYS